MRVSLSGTSLAARAALALCLVPLAARAQEWSRFEWVKATYSGKAYEKAALLLPVRLKGVEGVFYMQLDTGLSSTILYEVPYAQVLREKAGRGVQRLVGAKTPTGYSVVRFEGSVAGVEPDHAALLMRDGYGAPLDPKSRHPSIGSAGLSLFAERPLILDFRRRRFAVMGKGAALPEELERRATFFDVGLRGGKLFVPVTHGGEPLGDVFYDTGASAFNVLTPGLWRRLTGRAGGETDNERVTTLAWGRPVVLVGARTRGPLHVGPLDVGRVMVYFREGGAENLDFEKWPVKVDGLIGNAPFYDDHTVIIDLPRRRMGVLKGSRRG